MTGPLFGAWKLLDPAFFFFGLSPSVIPCSLCSVGGAVSLLRERVAASRLAERVGSLGGLGREGGEDISCQWDILSATDSNCSAQFSDGKRYGQKKCVVLTHSNNF